MKLNLCKWGLFKDENQKFCCVICSLNKGHGPRCKQITKNNIDKMEKQKKAKQAA